MNSVTTELRKSLFSEASLKKAVAVDRNLDSEGESGIIDNEIGKKFTTERAMITVEFPEIPGKASREKLALLRGPPQSEFVYKSLTLTFLHLGLVDLDRVVVVTGFGELGPYGNARTRWDYERSGEFSLEGCIELAWMMGLIQYSTSNDRRASWAGWVDRRSGEHVLDHEIKARYEETILKHTGIRIIEPELSDGYDPFNKTFLHQVALNADMGPLEVSTEEAAYFRQKHGTFLTIFHIFRQLLNLDNRRQLRNFRARWRMVR